jgi:exodeoxyribonuclease VII small subunit
VSDPTPPSDPPTGSVEEQIGYAAALAELDDILHELDGDQVDVDVLGTRVRRAAELLRVCRDRIAGARFEVEQVVAELEAETEPAESGDPTGPDADPANPD